MKIYLAWSILMLPLLGQGQSLMGTWQLTEDKTCFQSQFEESETEKEISSAMGASRNAVAKLIRFGEKGKGEEGIFSQGKRKGSSMNEFRYQVKGNELQFIDRKSGMITSRFIIDELTGTTLRFHNAMRDCEVKTFVKVK
ncbi:MAG: lipocalin family protein [Bacteroidota bacterium]